MILTARCLAPIESPFWKRRPSIGSDTIGIPTTWGDHPNRQTDAENSGHSAHISSTNRRRRRPPRLHYAGLAHRRQDVDQKG
jgi:hypothetical protein